MFFPSLIGGLLGGLALFAAWFVIFGKKVSIEERHLISLYVALAYAIGGLISGPCFTYGFANSVNGLSITGGIITFLVILASVIVGFYYTITKNKHFIC